MEGITNRLDHILDRVEALERAVSGAAAEGNIGLINRMDRETVQTVAVHLDFERRIISNEKAISTMKAYAAGAAFAGGLIGGGTTLAIQLLGWVA